MTPIIFNPVGLVMLVVSFGAAFLLGHTFGFSGEGPLMIAASPLVIGSDLLYRFKLGEKHWFHPNGGGMLFYLPVWIFGEFWLVLGIVYTVQKAT